MVFCLVFSGIFWVLFSSQPSLSHPQKNTGLTIEEEEISDIFTVLLQVTKIENNIPERNNLEDFVSKRRTRSLFRLGLSAVTKLLKGSKLTGASDYNKIYTKSGGYQRAIEDFYSVKPLRVQNIKKTTKVRGGTVKRGELYDRTILLYKGDAHKRPSLVILKNKDMFDKQAPLDVIFYDD